MCTPDKLECVNNIKKEYDECLPQCAGIWIINYKMDDEFKKVFDNQCAIVSVRVQKLIAWCYLRITCFFLACYSQLTQLNQLKCDF